MTNTQRKKIKMVVSYKKGYYKPPYPYTLRVRGLPLINKQWQVYAGCGVCNGYGYIHTNTYNETEDCVCVTRYNGVYSKKAYRFN